MAKRTNQPLLDDLPAEQRKAILNGADALATLHDYSRRSFDLWMLVARGVAPLVAIADRPGMSRKARQNLLRDNGYGSLDPSMVTRLVHMAAHEPAVREWRDGLPPRQYEAWQSPTSICKQCPAIRTILAKPRPAVARPPVKSVDEPQPIPGNSVFTEGWPQRLTFAQGEDLFNAGWMHVGSNAAHVREHQDPAIDDIRTQLFLVLVDLDPEEYSEVLFDICNELGVNDDDLAAVAERRRSMSEAELKAEAARRELKSRVMRGLEYDDDGNELEWDDEKGCPRVKEAAS
jgi:hypothetical protein